MVGPKLRAEEQRRDGASLPKMSMADFRDIATSQERAQMSRDAELRIFGLLPSQKEGKNEGGGREEGKGKPGEGSREGSASSWSPCGGSNGGREEGVGAT